MSAGLLLLLALLSPALGGDFCARIPGRVRCVGAPSLQELAQELKTFGSQRPLSRLDILQSNVTQIPSNLLYQAGLRVRELALRDLPLTRVTGGEEWPFLGQESTLETLVMRRCGLTSNFNLPRLEELQALETLDLTENLLQTVPSTWFLVPPPSLKLLYLSQNKLTNLTGLESLSGLELLDVSENQLEELSRRWLHEVLPRLSYLYLSYNKLKAIPSDFFTGMPVLRRLYLGHNRLFTLPLGAWERVWPRLTYLDLLGNGLECDCRLLWVTVTQGPELLHARCEGPSEPRSTGRRLVDLYPWDVGPCLPHT